MAPVCKFYLQNSCKFGDRCKFEHPRNNSNYRNEIQEPRPQPRGNPFDAFRDHNDRGDRSFQGNSRSQPRDNGRRTPDYRDARYDLDPRDIENDLKNDAPAWPLSVYAGGGKYRDVPRHLIGGELEQSPEEVRCNYYLARLQGNEQAAQQLENQAASKASEQKQAVLGDISGAIRYVAAGKNEHPNRHDIVDESNRHQPQQQNLFAKGTTNWNPPAPTPSTGFGQPSSLPRLPGFGQPSSLGQPSPFGQPTSSSAPAFGRSSDPVPAAPFGQPSALGQPSAFGQPSSAGGAPGFGQPSAIGSTPAIPGFGRPSASGANPGFGQPSALGQPSAFGQPSGLGGAAPAFGRAPLGPSPLAQAPSAPRANAFGAPAFGQPSSQPAVANPFGQPSSQSPAPTPFGPPNPFNTSPAPQQSPFGAPSSQSSQPFAATQHPGFGQQPSSFEQTPTLTPAFPRPSPTSIQPSNPFGNRPAQPTIKTQINGFAPQNGSLASAGPPSATPGDAFPPIELYGGNEQLFEQKYAYVREKGQFEDGIMPEFAPQHQWVGWGPQEREFLPKD